MSQQDYPSFPSGATPGDGRAILTSMSRPASPLRGKPRPGNIEVVDEDMAAILRHKTPAERLAIADGLFRSAQLLLSGYLRTQHPDWDEESLGREVARRISLESS
ncbi:MAG TPA: hypothetical protein VF017_18290 [Thermoanaerobaculia bacterium]|nr:hypothetical protein [Thermoanaerobaculia bacterium]